MFVKKILLCLILLFVLPLVFGYNRAVVDDAFARYAAAGGKNFNAAKGKRAWDKKNASANNGKGGGCYSCHGTNLSREGKHVRTGKVISAMAPSANPKRFATTKKLKKWFKRNCKWVYKRECSAQEKGDFLTYLIQQ